MHQRQMWVCPARARSLTLWREESRQPVSCRKTLSDFAPRVRVVFGFLAKPFPGCDEHHVPSEKPGAGWGGCSLSSGLGSLHWSPSDSSLSYAPLPYLPYLPYLSLFYTFMDTGHSLRPLRGKGGWTVEAMDLGTPVGLGGI